MRLPAAMFGFVAAATMIGTACGADADSPTASIANEPPAATEIAAAEDDPGAVGAGQSANPTPSDLPPLTTYLTSLDLGDASIVCPPPDALFVDGDPPSRSADEGPGPEDISAVSDAAIVEEAAAVLRRHFPDARATPSRNGLTLRHRTATTATIAVPWMADDTERFAALLTVVREDGSWSLESHRGCHAFFFDT